jgi:hypothetical protein
MHVSQRLKTYEHVGMADNHHKHRSDERQMTSFDHINNDEQSTMTHLMILKDVKSYEC